MPQIKVRPIRRREEEKDRRDIGRYKRYREKREEGRNDRVSWSEEGDGPERRCWILFIQINFDLLKYGDKFVSKLLPNR